MFFIESGKIPGHGRQSRISKSWKLQKWKIKNSASRQIRDPDNLENCKNEKFGNWKIKNSVSRQPEDNPIKKGIFVLNLVSSLWICRMNKKNLFHDDNCLKWMSRYHDRDMLCIGRRGCHLGSTTGRTDNSNTVKRDPVSRIAVVRGQNGCHLDRLEGPKAMKERHDETAV